MGSSAAWAENRYLSTEKAGFRRKKPQRSQQNQCSLQKYTHCHPACPGMHKESIMTELERKQLKTVAVKVRMGIVESTHAAKCGHPGGSLSAADLFTYLYFKEMKVDPKNPKMPEFHLGIFFSGLTRSLVSSDYNLRVSECKAAAWNMLAYTDQPLKTLDKTFLRDVPREVFDQTKERMPARFARRAEHFYSEYKRVRKGVTAWESGNLELFGKLSFESCESSIHNYECGSPELIAIYEIMRDLDGVYGGRFSGAGFKGACIALVDPAKEDSIREKLTAEYLRRFPEYEGTFEVHFCKTDDGARFV